MAAIRDNNRQTVLCGVLFSDKTTLVPIEINSSNGGIGVNTTDSITGAVTDYAIRDDNRVVVVMAENSSTGEPCPVYVDANGQILIDNT